MVRHNISIYFCQKQKKWNNINIFILEKKNYQSERYEKWTDFIFDDGRNVACQHHLWDKPCRGEGGDAGGGRGAGRDG